MSTSKIHLQYVGPFDAVVVLAPTGRTVKASIGDVVEFLPNEAKTLKGHPDWVKPSIPAPTEPTTEEVD